MLKKAVLYILIVCFTLALFVTPQLKPPHFKEITKNKDSKTTESSGADAPSSLNYNYVKAIWLSQFDLFSVYTDGKRQRDELEYTRLIKSVVNNIKVLGFNTVFIQLRPNGDSIYPSEIFPPSKYACGSYSSELSYDPFDIFLSFAREAGLSVHGWINPFRCMGEDEIVSLDSKYIIKKWYDENDPALKLENGRYYLDPSNVKARNLICDGAYEILYKYGLDGIHIDDYFYPTTSVDFDRAEYLEYRNNGGILSIDDFRRQNVNKLIKALYKTVKSYRKDVLFGVSPSGNNKQNYSVLYADTETWCNSADYIDYICPQVYFGFEHESCDFIKVCEEFSSIIKRNDVKLIVGMSLEKAASASEGGVDIYAGDGAREWIENKDVLLRMLEHIKTLEKCSGVAYFSYQYFYDTLTNQVNKKTAQERENFLPVLKEIK